jgi:WD40 repeat protein
VFSCSNDTSIKIWSVKGLAPLSSYEVAATARKTVGSSLNLNEDYDYVRAIAYSGHSQVLFSAADNGIVRRWDLVAGQSSAEAK